MKHSLQLASLALAWLSRIALADEQCGCSAENAVVRYIVVEMPPQASPTPEPTVIETTIGGVEEDVAEDDVVVAAAAAEVPSATPSVVATKTNSTTTYGPTPNPDVDCSSSENFKPNRNVSFYYGSADVNDTGAIKMDLNMVSDAVVLEYIDTIAKVDCGNPDDDKMTIFFNSTDALQMAVDDWTSDDGVIMITNHLGTCDEEFERGFFLVETITPNKEDMSLSCTASKKDLSSVANDLELTFSSIPAATLTKRLTLDPSASLTFSQSLDQSTVIFSQPPYLNVTAKEAYFTSTVGFSGYLHFNFWGFKLTDMYFDIDASFDSNVEIGVEVAADYTNSFKYAPDVLTYSLVDVPGIVKLGPGIAFAIGVDLAASGKVDAVAGFGIALPAGNVHVDLLDSSKSANTGWTPQYHSYANVTEKAEVGVNASASVTVELAINVLGGLLDLSTGLTATPGFNNKFTLESTQAVNGTANGTVVSLPDGQGCDQGIGLKSDFVFDLTAFATQWWSTSLYNTEIPIVDMCYEWI